MFVKFVSFILLFASWSAMTTPTNGQDFVPRCADCWCVPDGGVTGDNCPEYVEGITDDKSVDSETLDRYASFQLKSETIKLLSPDGEACFPFKEVVGDSIDFDTYPEANAPQCAKPASLGPQTVCAYKFDSCDSLEYEMMSYESEAAARADGARVTHFGPCGVCSNAFDFTKRGDPTINLRDVGIGCGLSYSISQSWQGLIDCYKREVGFTDECALLWSHYTATNSQLCALQCGAVDEEGTVPLNLDPPTCEYAACIECSESSFQPAMDEIQGRTLHGSGITEEIARPCDIFYPVVHDICDPLAGTQSPTVTPSPSISPTTAAPTVTSSPSVAPVTAAPTTMPTTSTATQTAFPGFRGATWFVMASIMVGNVARWL